MGEYATRNPASYHPGGVTSPSRRLGAVHQGNDRHVAERPEHRLPAGDRLRAGDVGDNLVFTIAPGTYFGVWQKLSTRNFGEAVSADAF